MAADRELLALAEAGEPSARVYTWSSPWVTLGRFQVPSDALSDPESTPFTVRPTGGWAVLHGHDLTVGYAFPVQRERPSVREAYLLATRPILDALGRCGLPAKLGGFGEPRAANAFADCFRSIGANDIVSRLTGRKVCGCAMRLSRNAALIQASIPIAAPSTEAISWIRGFEPPSLDDWDPAGFAAAFEGSLMKG